MIDVISPCTTFNDHEGSTKSYAYAKEHDEVLGEVSFVPFFEDISVEYDPGTTRAVELHDGSKLYLKKVAEDYDPTDKFTAMRLLARDRRAAASSRPGSSTSSRTRTTSSRCSTSWTSRWRSLPLERVRPGREALDEVMESLR